MSGASRAGVRSGGSGRLPDGGSVTWSVADGSRGRRWRAVTTGADGRMVQAILFELGSSGRTERLEVAAPAGLLTLHPEADESMLHGNVVRPAGIVHVALPWSPAHVLLIGMSPVSAAVAVRRLETRFGVGEGALLPVVEVAEDLVVRQTTWRVTRLDVDRWQLRPGAGEPGLDVTLDADGVIAGLVDAATWPMEIEPAG